jgi:hypothetical protein
MAKKGKKDMNWHSLHHLATCGILSHDFGTNSATTTTTSLSANHNVVQAHYR